MRKTIEVSSVLEMTNSYLADKTSTPGGREAACGLLESILFQSGQYGGFCYLETDEVEGGGSRRAYFKKGA